MRVDVKVGVWIGLEREVFLLFFCIRSVLDFNREMWVIFVGLEEFNFLKFEGIFI